MPSCHRWKLRGNWGDQPHRQIFRRNAPNLFHRCLLQVFPHAPCPPPRLLSSASPFLHILFNLRKSKSDVIDWLSPPFDQLQSFAVLQPHKFHLPIFMKGRFAVYQRCSPLAASAWPVPCFPQWGGVTRKYLDSRSPSYSASIKHSKFLYRFINSPRNVI